MSYSFQRSITIDHTKCGSSDSVNMPVLVSGVYAYLATIANGGAVHSSAGYDIVFTSDAAGLNLLNWQVEDYDPVTGTVVIWVQATCTSAVDGIFYMWYGNAAITTLQCPGGAVWYDPTDGAQYAAVYHFNGNPPSFADATFNGNNQTGSGVTAVSGKIDGAASFNGTTDYRVTTDPFFFIGSNNITLSAWVNSATLSTQDGEVICWDPVNGNASLLFSGGNLILRSTTGTGISVAAPSNSVWHYIVGTIDAAGNAKIYIDGALAASGVTLPPGTNGPNFLEVGRYGGGGFNFSGKIDEARVSANVYSADWILTEYNNQNSPSTFYAVGAAVVPPAGPTRPTYTWPTPIQKFTASGINDGVHPPQIPLSRVFPKWVNIGDLIVVSCDGSFPGGITWLVNDTLGNTYTESEFDNNNGGVGNSSTPQFWCVSAFAGVNEITVGGTMDQLLIAVDVEGSDAPPLSQGCSAYGGWPPPLASLSLGQSMQPVPTANSLAISSLFSGGDGTGFTSDTGDTLVQVSRLVVPASHVNKALGQFRKATAAGGIGPINLRVTSPSGDGGTASIFSKPLTRPGGLTAQYACRPSVGGATFFAGQPNVSTVLPYLPLIGDFVAVGVTTTGVGLTMAVGDDYGNVYTRQAFYDGTDPGIGAEQVAIFTTVITNLPSGNEAFKVKGTFTGTSGQLNHPGTIFLAAHSNLGTIGTITGYNCISATGGGTNLMKTDSAIVTGANTLQIAVLVGTSFVSAPFPMTIVPGTGLTVRQQLVEPQSCSAMSSFPNASQLGLGALLDQFISVPGTYDAEATINTGGAIVMITVPLINISLPCPLANVGVVGMAFTETLIASGGNPPYTYAVAEGYSLPPGLSLDPSTGIISGIPTAGGNFDIAYTVMDSLGNVGQTVGTCPISITNPPLSLCSPNPNPALDSYLELRKVLVAWKKETHLPVRGKS